MPGAASHREAIVVFEAESSAQAALTYWPKTDSDPENPTRLSLQAPAPTPAGGQIYRFVITGLEPGTRYSYQIELDDKVIEPAWQQPSFRTLDDWNYRAPAPDFTFITGSCNYINEEKYDRPGKPYGQGNDIFSHMAQSGADFMLWLGDNLYLRPADYTSRSGIWQRYRTQMSAPEMQQLRSAMHHYAIWDDHDFGPNDSSKTYPFADTALEVFRSYWANPTYGQPDYPGVYTTFVWGDCSFFLLDNRSYRDANDLDPKNNPQKTQFGTAQKEWLKQSLLEHSRSSFKFIVMGGQFLHDHAFESFADFPADRKEILNFIRENQIEGVIFISGDRHFTELTKVGRAGTYPLYDLTSSPISAGIAGVIKSGKETNPQRVPGTLAATQNYCSVTVTGEKKERKLVIRCFDKENNLQWTHEILAAELR
jgi:alkaline phosphatase D